MDLFLSSLFIIICILLIVVVLLQKGRGGGLGSAFGGIGTSAFGTKTGDFFTWVTIILTGLFLLLSVWTTLALRPEPGVVASPAFTPRPGEFTEPVAVSIVSTTRRANIFYTTDGSEPTQESTPYERMAVKLQPGQTLKARAFRTSWRPSEIAVGYYGPAPQTQPGAQQTTDQAVTTLQTDQSPAEPPAQQAEEIPAEPSAEPPGQTPVEQAK